MTQFAQAVNGGTNTFYYKGKAKAVGAGKVYVSAKNKSIEEVSSWEESSESDTLTVEASANNANGVVYLYAKTDDSEHAFKGWSSSETEYKEVSTENPYRAEVTTKATKKENTVVKEFYAHFTASFFKIANIPSYTHLNEEYALSIDKSSDVKDSIVYTSSDTEVATINDKGVIYGLKVGKTIIKAIAGERKDSFECYVRDIKKHVQIENSDFESWGNYDKTNNAPDNWNSFQTAGGTFAGLVNAKQVDVSSETRPGSKGEKSVVIWSRNAAGLAKAQGNLTTGRINAGGMTATAKGNYNSTYKDDSNYNETLGFVPDSLVAWVKFKPAEQNDKFPNAHIAAIIHDYYDYITYGTPESDATDPENSKHIHSIAEYDFKAVTDTVTTEVKDENGNVTATKRVVNYYWQRISVPFVISDKNILPDYILVNISTNAVPGEGQVGDSLWVDDIELIYNNLKTYKVTYMIDGKKYMTQEYTEGMPIEAPTPSKVGYDFLGWDNVPEFMKNEDIVINGSFVEIAKYIVNFMADEETTFSTDSIYAGTTITVPKTEPTKEGYTFTGWDSIPETMPANDITIKAMFTVNKYLITYINEDDTEFQKDSVTYGTKIVAPETNPTKEGHTFAGWDSIPENMPARDLTLKATFTVNTYSIVYKYNGETVKTENVKYDEDIPSFTYKPENDERYSYSFIGWKKGNEDFNLTKMPAEDIELEAVISSTDGIESATNDTQIKEIYNQKGILVASLQKGMNIVKYSDGTIKKIMK